MHFDDPGYRVVCMSFHISELAAVVKPWFGLLQHFWPFGPCPHWTAIIRPQGHQKQHIDMQGEYIMHSMHVVSHF